MPGNRLSRKHGLRALSGREAGPRRNKAGWLLRGLVQDLAAEGRTLKPYEKQRARRWCELEVIASDAIEELLAQDWPKQPNTKLWEIYHAAVNQQGRIAAELGITRATEEKVRDPAREAQEAQQRLRARVLGAS